MSDPIEFTSPMMMGQSFFFKNGFDQAHQVWLQEYEFRIHADGVLVRYRLWNYAKKTYGSWCYVSIEDLLESYHYGSSRRRP